MRDFITESAAPWATNLSSARDVTSQFDVRTVDHQTLHGLSSHVVVDATRGEVYKTYHPRWWIKALYWGAFQARFPYSWRRAALEAARERRTVARIFTRYWFGEDCVARILAIHEAPGGPVLISEFVRGRRPADPRRTRLWLKELRRRFTDAGLPTWQITTYNPRALSNVIETPDHRLVVVDLESTLVTPFGDLAKALRCCAYPIFDDVDFERLRQYFARHRDALISAVGMETTGELEASIGRLERCERAWRDRELRLLERLLRWSRRQLARYRGGHR